MNLLAFIRPFKPEPVTDVPRALNGQYLPSTAERRRRANAASVEMQLHILTARLSPEERRTLVANAATVDLRSKGTVKAIAGEGR